MYYDTQIKNLIKTKKPLFKAIYLDWQQYLTSETNKLQEWQEKKNIVEKKLASEINSIDHPHLSYSFDEYLTETRKKLKACDYNWDRLRVFLNLLPKVKKSKKIFKYNENYCQTIIKTIANEYLKIKNYFAAYPQAVAAKEKEKYTKQKEKAISTWNDLISNELAIIVQDEFTATINEINKQVYNS